MNKKQAEQMASAITKLIRKAVSGADTSQAEREFADLIADPACTCAACYHTHTWNEWEQLVLVDSRKGEEHRICSCGNNLYVDQPIPDNRPVTSTVREDTVESFCIQHWLPISCSDGMHMLIEGDDEPKTVAGAAIKAKCGLWGFVTDKVRDGALAIIKRERARKNPSEC